MLRAAQRYAAVATAIEDEHVNDWGDPHVLEHMDNVISAVLNAATFLEAMVNELYTDAADGHGLTNDGYWPYATNLGRRVRMLVTGPVLQRQ